MMANSFMAAFTNIIKSNNVAIKSILYYNHNSFELINKVTEKVLLNNIYVKATFTFCNFFYKVSVTITFFRIKLYSFIPLYPEKMINILLKFYIH